jgi:hypothetical protein
VSLLCISVIPAVLHAQSNAVDGAVAGYVKDSSGIAVNGANVTLLNTGTNVTHRTTTDSRGYYRFPLVSVGSYNLTIAASGFSTIVRKGIAVSVGQLSRNDVTMQIGQVSQTVTVSAPPDILETGNSVIGSVLGRKEVADLPIPSRNLFNFQLLAPGVVGVPTSTFSTTQFTFGGNERAQWNLDGLDNTQKEYNRQIRIIIVTPEAVQETQTLSSGYSAEFGHAAGGQVNVLLKSGTNNLHGSALYQFRPSDLQATPSLSKTLPPSRSWQDGAGTLGGPIRKDKLFYFVQYEDNPYWLPASITISPSNATALGLPSSQLGYSPFGETYQTLVGKVTYNIGKKNTGYVRYAEFTNHQPYNSSGLTIPQAGRDYHDHMNGGGAQLATAFNSRWLNEFRIGVNERDVADFPNPSGNSSGAYVHITGVANIGYDPLYVTTSTERTLDVIDNVTYTRGHHTFKFGGELEHTYFDQRTPINRAFTFGGLSAQNGRPAVSALNQYLYTVAGDIDPATGKPYTYTYYQENGGNPILSMGFNFPGGFVQDEYRATQNLLVNMGVRYDVILFPEFNAKAPFALSRSINNDYGDIAPRFALTYSPSWLKDTVIRAAYGLYYDIPGLATFYTAAQNNGQTFLSYQIAGGAAGAPVYPNIPDTTQASFAVKPSINAFDQNFHDTYQNQANLQVERQLAQGTLLTVGYMFAGLRHGLYARNINLGTPTSYLADGRPVFGGPKPNTNFNQINLIESGTSTNFNGMFINVRHELRHNLEFGVNYMYSHALADGLGEGSAGEDPTSLKRDYGNANDDVRHFLAIQGIYQPHVTAQWGRLVNGFELTSTYFYNSGYPINEQSGVDLNKDGNTNDRPLFVPSNSLRGPGMSMEDAQLMRNLSIRERYHFSLFVAAENLLNSSNASCSTSSGCTGAVVHTAGASDFGRVTSAMTARNLQTGVKFTF